MLSPHHKIPRLIPGGNATNSNDLIDRLSVNGAGEGSVALVADDHAVFRDAIARILRDDCGFERVIETMNHDSTLQCLKDRPDVSFLSFDLRMAGVNCFDEIKTIRRLYPDLRLVVVSASERRQDMIEAIIVGAHGYVPKILSRSEIADAFYTVLQDRCFLPWSVTDISADASDAANGGEGVREVSGRTLTARQMEVLRLLRAGKTNKEIARELQLTESTVKVHVNTTYKILGVHNRVGAAAACPP